jgi:hypothetical protein
MNNENTLLLKGNQPDEQREKKAETSHWKLVALGGFTGILMGAGCLYASQVIAKKLEDASESEGATSHTTENGLRVADVDQSLSFKEAFEAARAEVGPGGVFHWHGGIYNTFSAGEWNSMSAAEKSEFAQQVSPEVRPEEIPAPTDEHPDIVVESSQEAPAEDVEVVDQNNIPASQDAEVHIVGYTNVEGHLAVGLDMDNDGQADIAIIDMDDNQVVNDPDLVVDSEGNMATIGELAEGYESNMESTNESPNITEDAPAEPDYPLFDI